MLTEVNLDWATALKIHTPPVEDLWKVYHKGSVNFKMPLPSVMFRSGLSHREYIFYLEVSDKLFSRGGGGVLTNKWYTGMLKGFEVHFCKFWYIDGWVIVTYSMHPICKIGCILEILAKKAPNLGQIRCFLQKNGTEMGHKMKSRFSRYRDGRNFKLYFEHPLTIFWRRPPPRLIYK